MVFKSVLKVAGGKLVKIELHKNAFNPAKIGKVKITGDFFVHPEEALAELENCLEDCGLEAGKITGALEKKILEKDALLVGFSPQDIAQAILVAADSQEQWAEK